MTIPIERNDPSESKAMNLLSAIPFIFVMSMLLCADFVAASGLRRFSRDVWAGILLGSGFAQVVVSAVWISIVRLPLALRVFMGSVLFAVATLSIFRLLMNEGEPSIALTIAMVMTGLWIFYQIPLWSARAFGWVVTRDDLTVGVATETQFGIRHLLIWTTLVAVFFAVFRALINNVVDDVTLSNFKLTREDFHAGTVIISASAVIMYPVIWGCFVQKRAWIWAIVAVVWGGIVTVVQLMMWKLGDSEILIGMNIVQMLAAATVLLTLRLAGFRLRKV